jgi:glutamine amidotransferase
MRTRTVAVVDYGMGNHASVAQALRDIGFRVRISADISVLDESDVLLLPGVGAYPSAMKVLHERGLVSYLQRQARDRRPIIGICLGMQLLASASHEHHYTAGLDLVPGEVVPVEGSKWHIGWNTIECVRNDAFLMPSNGQAFYFNHSFSYQGPSEYQVAISRHVTPLTSVIRRGNVVGLQFHPEKSQAAGRVMLKNLINGLCHA